MGFWSAVNGVKDSFLGSFEHPEQTWDQFKNGNTNEYNKQIADENLKYQKEWNEQQLGFARDQYEYQKALNEKQMQREDSSYQRTVSDMRSAGLSPLMMSSTDSSSPLTAPSMVDNGTQPLYNGFTMQDKGLGDVLSNVATVGNQVQSFRSTEKTLDSQDLDNQRKLIDNFFELCTLTNRLSQSQSEAIISKYNALSEREKHTYNAYYGISDNMDDKEKLFRIVGTQLGLFESQGNGSDFRNEFEDLTKDITSFTHYGSPTKVKVQDVAKIKSSLSALLNAYFSDSKSDSDTDDFEEKVKNRPQTFKELGSLFKEGSNQSVFKNLFKIFGF